MKVLMLVNWKVEYCSIAPKDKQPPDYYVPGISYWFFRYFTEPDKYQVDVVDISSFLLLEKFEKNKLRFYVFQTLKVLSRLNNYDVIISHGMQSGIVLSLIRRLFGKGKYKHVVFDVGAFNSGRESGRALKVMQFASKSIDALIYHNSIQKEYYQNHFPWLLNSATYIPFGTDADFFSNDVSCDADSIIPKERYILSIGYNKRDWDTLVLAYELFSKKNDGSIIPKLYLLGNEKYVADNPNVVALAPVNVNEMKGYINGALFCVLPLVELPYAFGQMTLLQQMAMGKAVIAADVSSLAEYTTDCSAVMTYQPGDYHELAKKMCELNESESIREEIGRNGKKLILDTYNEKNMAVKIGEVLRSVVQR